MQKSTRYAVHNATKKGFVHEEIRAAAQKLTVVGQDFKARRGSVNRTKTDLFLDDILTCLYTLGDEGHLPKITVNSIDLLRMPLVAVAEGDCVEVSTRISLMEKGLNELKDSMNKLISSENSFRQVLQEQRNPEVVIGRSETTTEGLVVGAGQGLSLIHI